MHETVKEAVYFKSLFESSGPPRKESLREEYQATSQIASIGREHSSEH